MSPAAVIVISCDAYADVWQPFFSCFWKQWPDCPYPVSLVSNERVFDDPRVRGIAIGPDQSWSGNLRLALELVPEEYVLLFIDDLLLIRRVNTDRVTAAIAWLQGRSGNYLRLNAFPKPEVPISSEFGLLPPGSLYRTATVASVWRKALLAQLLVPGESAWDFETRGATRSDLYDGFYSTRRCYISTFNAVIKGRWRRSALRRLRRLGIDPGPLRRPVLSRWAENKLTLHIVANRLLYLLPWSCRRWVRARILSLLRGGA